MKEEMQGFHMTPNFEICISEITLFWPDYMTKRITPRSRPEMLTGGTFMYLQRHDKDKIYLQRFGFVIVARFSVHRIIVK